LIGPRRALLRFAGSSRSSNNYSYMEAREISPTEIELTAAPFEGHPEYVQGCLCALIDLTGGKNGEVELISHDREQERVVLRARWGAGVPATLPLRSLQRDAMRRVTRPRAWPRGGAGRAELRAPRPVS